MKNNKQIFLEHRHEKKNLPEKTVFTQFHMFSQTEEKNLGTFLCSQKYFFTHKKKIDNFFHLKIKWFLVIYLLNNNIYWFIFLYHHLLSNLCRFDFGSFSPPYLASLSTTWLFDKWFITHGYFGESRCLLMYSICK